MEIAIFACVLLIIASGLGVVMSVAYACQEWWEMEIIERIASILAIACCIVGVVAGFAPWY
jgi:hypothetical protein